ncbi:MAG: glycosyltransferase family 2 protein [Deltaproteobacteria bacterium]|nr:glycosyltransferase family 2 protein [Deltaproteobacteria bacterium]
MMSALTPFDVLVTSYGSIESLQPLVDSLRAQTLPPKSIAIWHNGPHFLPSMRSHFGPGVQLLFTGENLGYGGACNRLFEKLGDGRALVVNPDVELLPDCLERLAESFVQRPGAMIVGGALVNTGTDGSSRVNAYGQRLTMDLVGINTDRGRTTAAFVEEASRVNGEAGSRYLGPSGALFAVDGTNWKAYFGNDSLFCESLFLYMEDVALWMKVRRAGGDIEFCPTALGRHRFSESTGQRSGLKLYHVERNRLWLLRALWGRAAVAVTTPFSVLRMGAYAWAARARGGAGSAGEESRMLAVALWRGWQDGLRLPVPDELQRYLGPEKAPSDLWAFVAPLSEQLRDPTALSVAKD